MPKPKTSSRERIAVSKRKGGREYSLQGSALDIPTSSVLAFSPQQRAKFLDNLLDAFSKEIEADRLSLKANVYFDEEMADLRRLLRSAPDQYLYADDKGRKRTVLGKGAPGATHIYWSLNQIWKMATKQGNLADQIKKKAPALVRKLDQLFDQSVKSKDALRQKEMAIPCALSFLQFDKSSGSAFPPFHARFLANKYLPKQGDSIVLDPCAGWGGRLLGSLLVNRIGKVTYIGVDPAKANEPAYTGLTGRVTHWLKKEVAGPREAKIFYEPFEDFLRLGEAKALHGKVDFALTSPPYFTAENYNPTDPNQSANRYPTYDLWRSGFYRPLIAGVFDLLKPGGHFALNIADVQECPTLERDARKLANEVGFRSAGFYKLAMSISPAQRKAGTARHVVEVDGKLFKYEPVFIFRKPDADEQVVKIPAVFPKSKKEVARRKPTQKATDTTLPDLGDWKDPYPAPRVEKVDGFYVVRDDLLQYGSKIRFLDYLVSTATESEFVYGGSNKVGWGAISLAYVCKRYGKKAICFMAERKELTWHQQQFKSLGGKIVPVPNGMLPVTMARARSYAAKKPQQRRLMNIGFDDPTVLASIVHVARDLSIKPKEIWTVASSGTLTRGLQLAFPDAKVFAVQIGHTLTKETIGSAKVLVSPYKYDKRAPDAELPPFPSEPYYDAKLWAFVKKKASRGALIWNVA